MSTSIEPSLSGMFSPRIRREYGGSPFRADADLLALGFAEDETLWSVEEPGVLRHWNIAEEQQIGWFPLEETATLWCFSPGAKLLAAGCNDISIWEVDGGEMQATWLQPSWVTALAFRQDGRVLASGHDDGCARVWDWESQELLRNFPSSGTAISAVAISSDGRSLAAASEDRVIRVWDIASGQEVARLVGHTDRIPALAWQPGQRRLVSAGWDTTARVWDIDACEPVILLNSHVGQIHAMTFNPTGMLLACADSANAIHIWDANAFKTIQVLRQEAAEVQSLAFSPNGRLASAGAERVIHVCDPLKLDETQWPGDPLLSRTGLEVHDQGRRLLSLGIGTAIRVWDTETGQTIFTPQVAPPVRAFAASPDGRWIVAALANKGTRTALESLLVMVSAATGKRRGLLEGPAVPVTALAFSPDSKTFATGSYQSSDVWLWDTDVAEPTLILPGIVEGCSIEQLRFDPRNHYLAVSGIDWLATSGVDGHVVLWDLALRKEAFRFKGGATALAFHPSGRWLATAALSQTVCIWDLGTGQKQAELSGHTDLVTTLAWRSDGAWLTSGSDDHTVRIWDVSGEPLGVAELDAPIKAVVFSPDGRYLYTGNANGSCYQIATAQMLVVGADEFDDNEGEGEEMH